MMESLWITELPHDRTITVTRTVRDLTRLCYPDATMEDADRTIKAFDQHGFVHVGDFPEGAATKEHLARIAAVRERATGIGIVTRADLNPARYAASLRARKMSAEGATPEDVFAAEAPGTEAPTVPPDPDTEEEEAPSLDAYRTALVLMAGAEGQPLKAAAQAKLIGIASDDLDFYSEVITALCASFPTFLPALVAQQGIADVKGNG